MTLGRSGRESRGEKPSCVYYSPELEPNVPGAPKAFDWVLGVAPQPPPPCPPLWPPPWLPWLPWPPEKLGGAEPSHLTACPVDEPPPMTVSRSARAAYLSWWGVVAAELLPVEGGKLANPLVGGAVVEGWVEPTGASKPADNNTQGDVLFFLSGGIQLANLVMVSYKYRPAGGNDAACCACGWPNALKSAKPLGAVTVTWHG